MEGNMWLSPAEEGRSVVNLVISMLHLPCLKKQIINKLTYMNKRREFIKTSGAIALGSLILPRLGNAGSFFNNKKLPPIGIQLYTLSPLMMEDAKGTLQKVAAIGYKELEGAASQKGYYYGYKPKE